MARSWDSKIGRLLHDCMGDLLKAGGLDFKIRLVRNQNKQMEYTIDDVWRLVERSMDDFDAAFTGFVNSRLPGVVNAIPGREGTARFPSSSGRRQAAEAEIRLVKIVLAMTYDRPERLTDEEYQFARRARPALAWPDRGLKNEAASPSPQSLPMPLRLEAAYGWMRSGRGDRKRVLASAATPVLVPDLSEEDAPVVLRLRFAGGEWFPVRQWGDAWLRPLMAPNETGPVTPNEFAAAMASGVAWRDRPYHTADVCPPTRGPERAVRPIANLADMAKPLLPENDADRVAMQTCANDVVTACHRLFATRETVWIETPEPKFAVVGRHTGNSQAWEAGLLNALEPQGTISWMNPGRRICEFSIGAESLAKYAANTMDEAATAAGVENELPPSPPTCADLALHLQKTMSALQALGSSVCPTPNASGELDLLGMAPIVRAYDALVEAGKPYAAACESGDTTALAAALGHLAVEGATFSGFCLRRAEESPRIAHAEARRRAELGLRLLETETLRALQAGEERTFLDEENLGAAFR